MISIIVPIYKVESYIDKCIKSVLNQSFANFELILVDDGSPDACGEICDEYAKTDSRIKVVHKENGGLSSARNAGLDIAKGKYIFFLDGDDAFTENALQILHDAICNSEADVVFAGYNAVDENEILLHTSLPDDEIIADERKYTIVYEQTQLVMAATKLYKKEVFDKLRFREGKVNEDVFLYHEMANNAKSIYCIPFAAINYLQRTDSITGRKFSLRNYDAVEALFERADFFEKMNLSVSRKATIDYIYTYLLQIIFRIDLSDSELKNKFIEYYKKWKQLSLSNKDVEFYLVLSLYRLNILRGPFGATKVFRIAHIMKKVIAGRKIIIKILCSNFCRKSGCILISMPLSENAKAHITSYEQYKIFNEVDMKNIIEIKCDDYQRYWSLIKRIVRKKDVIAVKGWSIGTLQSIQADVIKKLIKTFENNKIIIFAENVSFSTNFIGKKEYESTKEAFSLHNNLLVILGDVSSYKVIKEMLPDERIYLCQ